MTCREDSLILAGVTLRRTDIANAAVSMIMVVPVRFSKAHFQERTITNTRAGRRYMQRNRNRSIFWKNDVVWIIQIAYRIAPLMRPNALNLALAALLNTALTGCISTQGSAENPAASQAGDHPTDPRIRSPMEALAFKVARQRATRESAKVLETTATFDQGYTFRRLQLIYKRRNMDRNTLPVLAAFEAYCRTLPDGRWSDRRRCKSRDGKFWVEAWTTSIYRDKVNYEVINVFDDKGIPPPHGMISSDPFSPWNFNNYTRGTATAVVEGVPVRLNLMTYMSNEQLEQRAAAATARNKADGAVAKANIEAMMADMERNAKQQSAAGTPQATPAKPRQLTKARYNEMLRDLNVAVNGVIDGCRQNGGEGFRSGVSRPTRVEVKCRTMSRMMRSFVWYDEDNTRLCVQIRNNPPQCGPSY